VYDDALIRPWFECAVDRVPGLALFDAHAHIGFNDPDGLQLSARDLIETMEAVASRSVVAPLHEPDGYSAANDRVLEECEQSAGRLVPFCRVDPRSDAVGEARRCVEAGARGIKLHPRAERFELSDPELEGVFALAHERRLPVLIHAGRGIPALGRDALTLARRFPSAPVILAHGAICDLNWIWREAQHQPNLYFDTAWWHSTDLGALFALIPPGQILYGSDPPYFTPMLIATCVIRTALQAGVDADRVRAIVGGQLERLLDGKEPLDLGPAPGGSGRAPSILLERVNAMLLLGVSRMLLGDTGYEPLALARLACDIGVDDAPETHVCRNVLSLLTLHEGSAVREGEGFAAPGASLVMLAANVTRTPDVPLPAIPELGNAAEIRSASLVGHRLLDAGEVTPRAAAVRRLSTIFPTVNKAGAASGANDGEGSDLRRSSLADHMIVDHLGAPRRAEETEDSHD
jgi:predicted TIM-barrel fold metal-dependent hydrolase